MPTDRRSRDLAALAGLLALGVVLPAVAAAVGGVLGEPHNDDFAYAKAALGLHRGGRIDLDGWPGMALVGQLVLAQPVLVLAGGDPAALAIVGLAAAAVAIGATHLLALRLLPPRRALLATLTLVVAPGLLRTVPTFMTDLPVIAATMGCLLAGVASAERGWDPRLLAVAILAGLAGVAIREFALAAPVAVLLAAWTGSRDRRRVAVPALLLAGGTAAVLAVAWGVEGRQQVASTFFLQPWTPVATLRALATLGALVLPALLVAAIRRPPGPLAAAGLAVTGVAALVAVALGLAPDPLVGNVWTRSGLGADQLAHGTRPDLFGDLAWGATRWAAVLGGLLLAGALGAAVVRLPAALRADRAATGRAGDPAGAGPAAILGGFVALHAGGLVAVDVAQDLFDRYLWPLVPVVAILLLRGLPAARSRLVAAGARAGAALATGGLLLATLAITANSIAYDGALRRMARAAVELGYDPATVDGGLPWVGERATADRRLDPPNPRGITAYGRAWPSLRTCALVSSDADPPIAFEVVVIRPGAYRLLGIAGPNVGLALHGSTAGDCPPVRPGS